MWHYIRVCIVCLDKTGTLAISEDPEEMQQKGSALSAETKQSPGTEKEFDSGSVPYFCGD